MSWQPFHSGYEAFVFTILKESRQTRLYKPPRNERLHPKCLDASWVAKTEHPDFISLQFIQIFLGEISVSQLQNFPYMFC